jgi:hypothetical protein
LADYWLKEYFPGDESSEALAPASVRRWLRNAHVPGKQAASAVQGQASLLIRRRLKRLRIERLDASGSWVWLLLWEEAMERLLALQGLGFTLCESEILYWPDFADSTPG